MTDPVASLDVDALVFDAYGTLFDVHSVDRARGGPCSRSRRRALAAVAYETARIHVADQFDGVPGRAARRFRRRNGAGARLRARRARDRTRIRRAGSIAGCVPHARAISRCGGGAGTTGATAAVDPVERHAGHAGAAGPARRPRRPPRRRALGRRRRHLQAAARASIGSPWIGCGLPPARIGFVSSNGWDAIGAKAFGFTTFWINRAAAPVDRHGPAPDRIISTLADLPPLLGSAIRVRACTGRR